MRYDFDIAHAAIKRLVKDVAKLKEHFAKDQPDNSAGARDAMQETIDNMLPTVAAVQRGFYEHEKEYKAFQVNYDKLVHDVGMMKFALAGQRGLAAEAAYLYANPPLAYLKSHGNTLMEFSHALHTYCHANNMPIRTATEQLLTRVFANPGTSPNVSAEASTPNTAGSESPMEIVPINDFPPTESPTPTAVNESSSSSSSSSSNSANNASSRRTVSSTATPLRREPIPGAPGSIPRPHRPQRQHARHNSDTSAPSTITRHGPVVHPFRPTWLNRTDQAYVSTKRATPVDMNSLTEATWLGIQCHEYGYRIWPANKDPLEFAVPNVIAEKTLNDPLFKSMMKFPVQNKFWYNRTARNELWARWCIDTKQANDHSRNARRNSP